MLQLHYFPGNASLVPHIVLEEIGAPFTLRRVDRAKGELTSAGYLALDARLARLGGPWLLGDDFGLADIYAFVLCRWTRGFARPARGLPHIVPWLDRMLERPAVMRAFATERLEPPFV